MLEHRTAASVARQSSAPIDNARTMAFGLRCSRLRPARDRVRKMHAHRRASRQLRNHGAVPERGPSNAARCSGSPWGLGGGPRVRSTSLELRSSAFPSASRRKTDPSMDDSLASMLCDRVFASSLTITRGIPRKSAEATADLVQLALFTRKIYLSKAPRAR